MQYSEIDSLSITVVVDNYYDALRKDPPCGRRFRTEPTFSIYAEHGLSFYIKVKNGYSDFCLFFDFGVDGKVLLHNLEVLRINPSSANALVLSHGHFDHYGGLADLLRHVDLHEAHLYVGKGCFTKRFSKRMGDESPTYLGQLKKSDLEGLTRIHEKDEPYEIAKGCYVTGRIERTKDYETIPDTLLVERNGKMKNDEFIEEQAIFFIVKGKGLVVLSGCAHRGIVNTVNHIMKVTGLEKIHAIIGGFHLINATEEKIFRTIEDIRNFSPAYIVPCHCTGFDALVAFSEMMDENFILNTVGTTYNF